MHQKDQKASKKHPKGQIPLVCYKSDLLYGLHVQISHDRKRLLW